MPRDEPVTPFRGARKGGRAVIPVEEPVLLWFVGERTKDGFRAAIDPAIRLNQLDGSFKLAAREFRKLRRHAAILKGEIINVIAGGVLPTANPQRAEVAVAVKDHQWLRGGRCHLKNGFHTETNSANCTPLLPGSVRAHPTAQGGTIQMRSPAGRET
jgi:hypothetical protein